MQCEPAADHGEEETRQRCLGYQHNEPRSGALSFEQKKAVLEGMDLSWPSTDGKTSRQDHQSLDITDRMRLWLPGARTGY